MSEPINVNQRLSPERTNVSPYRIELPPDSVGVKMVPHHVTTDAGGIVRTGKIEVRFDGSSLPTRDDKRKTIKWEKVAYNVAHQMAYYRQVYDNVVQRAEEAERHYSNASIRYEESQRELREQRRDNGQFLKLTNWWGFFLLPHYVKVLLRPTKFTGAVVRERKDA